MQPLRPERPRARARRTARRSRRLPRRPVGLGDEAGELAPDVRERAERAEERAPTARAAPRADRRLREVVDRRTGARAAPGRRSRAAGSSRGADEQVVGEAGRLDGGEPAADVRADEPVRIGLVVDLVADPDQPVATRAARAARRSRPATPGSVRSTQPTTPRDERHARPRSRGTRASRRCSSCVWTRTVPIDAGSGQQRREVVRPEPPVDRGEVVGQPRVVGRAGSQKVVVGVDDRGHGGVGASAGDQALGPQVVPQGRPGSASA